MHVVGLAIIVGWVAFWVYWLVASMNAKSGSRSWTRFAGLRIAIVLIVFLVVRGMGFKGHGSVTTDPWLEGIGLAVFLSGLALAIWARVHIGRNWGMPMSEKEDPELVTSGPYRGIRHPIYSGIILAMIGTAIAVSLYWLVAVAVLGGFFIYSAVMEERNMTRLFPDSYPAYKQSSKMPIPFLL